MSSTLREFALTSGDSDIEAITSEEELSPARCGEQSHWLLRPRNLGVSIFCTFSVLLLSVMTLVSPSSTKSHKGPVPSYWDAEHTAEKLVVDTSESTATESVVFEDSNESSNMTKPPHRSAPVSSSAEDLEAARSAIEDAEIAQELRMQVALGGEHLPWVSLAGNNYVVDDEGASISEVKGGLDVCIDSCEHDDACRSFTICSGVCYLKGKRLTSSEKVHHNDYCTSYFQTADTYRPSNRALASPSSAKAQTYYVYRAQGPVGPDGDYPLTNVNVASLGGAMWYLHDEVVKDCYFGGKLGQRRFGITRLRRFKITTKATQPLIDKGMNYGILSAFDSGESTGWMPGWHPGSGWKYLSEWNKYGYYVGCNNLGQWPHNEMVFQRATRYPNAIWYSLPGPCPMLNYKSETKECKINYPGGLCDSPDGRGNCTYHVEDAGEIDLDELVGITPKWRNREDFCRQGGFEGDGATTAWGRKLDFWNNIYDPNRNRERVQKAIDMFNKKYPGMPKVEDLPPPVCDFTTKGYF